MSTGSRRSWSASPWHQRPADVLIESVDPAVWAKLVYGDTRPRTVARCKLKIAGKVQVFAHELYRLSFEYEDLDVEDAVRRLSRPGRVARGRSWRSVMGFT